jgi:hypothetical protein
LGAKPPTPYKKFTNTKKMEREGANIANGFSPSKKSEKPKETDSVSGKKTFI